MFTKILIANRGEIAIRIITACQEMGIQTVAVYSEPDKQMPHVRLADEAFCIGPATPAESYLNIKKIIDVAKKTGAQAIHPGYGFLAENAAFAQTCADAGIIFIGPGPEVIRLMGDKIEAKQRMERSGIPVIPGYHGKNQDLKTLMKEADNIGFPLLVKATAGGGGKGMRVVDSEKGLKEAIEGAKREAKSSFGNDDVLLERYLDKPRHIEYQILCDAHKNALHLYERECSIQRRHQKIIEETPSPALDDEMRKRMGEAAVKAARAVEYVNAGTIEFMLDGAGDFYFMEMNTRLQVEHPITEMTTGVDLVKWQLRIAAGEKLTLRQEDITQRGHAIECRIYAENPAQGFLPSVGHLERVEIPQGPHVRNDTGIESGLDVSPFYDPMIAKLITSGMNREDCIENMLWALSKYLVMGVNTNISFLRSVLQHPAFSSAEITTHFIGDHFKEWLETASPLPIEALIALGIYDMIHKNTLETVRYKVTQEHNPWKSMGRWRMSD